MPNQPSKVRQLGRTEISNIFKYAHADGSFSAGKEVTKSLYKHWETELKILQEVGKHHENVIRYFPNNTNVTEENIILFMELCDGSFEEYILDNEIIPSTSDSLEKFNSREYFQSGILDICFQTVKGLQQLHNTYDIIHRDMKPSNVLLIRTPQKTTIAKVADFGLSRKLPTGISSHHTTSTSTIGYMAKECYEERWIKSSDIFALGIVLYFAFTGGKHPFGEKRYKIEGNIREGEPPDFGLLRNSDFAFNEEQKITMVDMIKRMIKHDPNERLHIDDVFCYPTFWNSRRKIDFFLKIRHNLHIDEANIPNQDVNEFDLGLLQDQEAGKKQKFNISETNLPKYLVLQKGEKRNKKNYHLIDKCRSVETLLDVIRNQSEDGHAFDRDKPQKLRVDFGIEDDTLDSDKFLSVFITPYPQLLVHLYELFRKLKGAADFYPRKVDQSPTSSLLQKGEQFSKKQDLTAGEATTPKTSSVPRHISSSEFDRPAEDEFMDTENGDVNFSGSQTRGKATAPMILESDRPAEDDFMETESVDVNFSGSQTPGNCLNIKAQMMKRKQTKSSNNASNNGNYETEPSNTNLQNSIANGSSYSLRKRSN